MADLVKVAPDIRTLISQDLITRFASLYESFQALTSIQVSHSVEWFSGAALIGTWIYENVTGSGTGVMDDAEDGGFVLTTGGSQFNQNRISFNDKRHYDETACIYIIVLKFDNSANWTEAGLVNDISTGLGGSSSKANVYYYTVNTNIALLTADGSSSSGTESDVTLDTSYHSNKVECGSANIKLTIDGVLKVTKTTNRPTALLAPFISVNTRDASAAVSNVLYYEVFNTSISILSSLYERLSALTQIMRQRVPETFSGSVINERWNFTDVVGTGSVAINDAEDGGAIVTSGGTDDDESAIDFNDKRQYDEADAVCILVASAIADSRFRAGFSENTDMSNSFALVDMDADNTNYELVTDDGSTESSTSSGIAIDTASHSHKVECGSANIKLTIDGVLKVTKTTNRPDQPQQPYFAVKARSTGAKTGNIRYLEAYNKLAVETDHPSVYELFNALTTIAKQHFWDWLDGSIWNNRWTKTDVAGTGSLTIQDAVDGGGLITSGATTNNETQANFNNKRQYAHDGAICIFTMKATSNTLSISYGGLSGNQLTFDGVEKSLIVVDSGNTNISLRTADASTSSETEGSVAIDTSRHSYKIENRVSDIRSFIDGVLDVTKTTNRPTTKQQPCLGVKTLTSSAKTTDVGYIEAENT